DGAGPGLAVQRDLAAGLVELAAPERDAHVGGLEAGVGVARLDGVADRCGERRGGQAGGEQGGSEGNAAHGGTPLDGWWIDGTRRPQDAGVTMTNLTMTLSSSTSFQDGSPRPKAAREIGTWPSKRR